MGLKLIEANLEDIPKIRSLADQVWHDHYPDVISIEQIDYMLDWMYSERVLAEQMQSGKHLFWLLLPREDSSADEATGFIGVEQKAPGNYFISKFYLSERGKGMGTAAFDALLEALPDARVIELFVNRQNYKSINFYFKIGFTIKGCVDMPIGRGFVMDDFLMEFKR